MAEVALVTVAVAVPSIFPPQNHALCCWRAFFHVTNILYIPVIYSVEKPYSIIPEIILAAFGP